MKKMIKGNSKPFSNNENDQKRLKAKDKRNTFEFLVPEIPEIKTKQNIIPTGSQIPRTPLKIQETECPPKSNADSELSGVLIEDEEFRFMNMIPKGREIPRTPPNYINRPFLMSGCVAKPIIQTSDLGVTPIGDIDIADSVIINIKDKEKNITVRKHMLPKAKSIDIVLAEMMDEVNVGSDEKSVDVDKNPQESTNVCNPVLKDITEKQEEKLLPESKRGVSRKKSKKSIGTNKEEKGHSKVEIKWEPNSGKENESVNKEEVGRLSEASAKGRKKRSNKGKLSSSHNLPTRQIPHRRAKEGVTYSSI